MKDELWRDLMKSNCYFWCAWKYITEGGKIKIYKSKTWSGWHTTWVDKYGQEWEYYMPRMRKQPWWYIPILYNGKVRKMKNDKKVLG